MVSVIHGFLLALGLIIPLGAQNIFVFNQGAVQKNWILALPVVITASLCDTFLILLAVMGVSVVVLANTTIKLILIMAGVIFLIYMGYVTFKSKPKSPNEDQKESLSAKKQILFAISVSLLNPHAILDTIGVIGTSSISYHGMDKILFTTACMIVSWIWFFSLALLGRLTGKLQSEKTMIYINKISAFLIWGTAVYILYSHIVK